MPNQYNFRSDITTTTDVRFTASRIAKTSNDPVLLEEIPASFGYGVDDNIELHFYSLPANALILSTVIKLTDNILKSHIVEFNDGSYKTYLRIDFTKLFIDKNLILVPGDYKLVLNFFSNEIGSYTNKILSIDAISPSRTEVQVSFNNTTDEPTIQENNRLAKEFTERELIKIDAIGEAQKIFKSGVANQDPTKGVTAVNVIRNIDAKAAERITRIAAVPKFSADLNSFIPTLYDNVLKQITSRQGDERIQESEYKQIIRTVVNDMINNLRQTVDNRIQIT